MSQYLVVVDPLSSGSALAPRAKDLYGLPSIAVLSRPVFAGLESTFIAADFDTVIWHNDLAQTICEIERLVGAPPAYLICGSEPGVALFDQLSQHWQLSPNVSRYGQCRRDKFLMQQRLCEAGLRHIPHLKSASADSIGTWCAEQDFTSFVVKPLTSFATDGVHFCQSPREAQQAASALLGTVSYSGCTNVEVLAEAFVSGPEFVVDSVSLDGRHVVVSMFRYSKTVVDGAPVYRTMTAVDPTHHPHITRYLVTVLDALGIRSGPAHSELIVTDDGPVLVETGARLHGGQGPRLAQIAFSVSPVDLALHARILPVDFLRMTVEPVRLVTGVTECFLSVQRSGIVGATHVDEICKSLPSFRYHTVSVLPGRPVERTRDLMTSYGRIVLANQDLQQLERDTRTVMECDAEGRIVTLA